MYVFSPLAHCILKPPQAIRGVPGGGIPLPIPTPRSEDNWLWTTWPSACTGFPHPVLPLACTQDSSGVGSVEIKPLANYEAGEQNRGVFKGHPAMGWGVNVKPAPCAFHLRLILPLVQDVEERFLTLNLEVILIRKFCAIYASCHALQPSCRSLSVFTNPRTCVETDVCQPNLSLLNRHQSHMQHLRIQNFHPLMLISPAISIDFSILISNLVF